MDETDIRRCCKENSQCRAGRAFVYPWDGVGRFQAARLRLSVHPRRSG